MMMDSRVYRERRWGRVRVFATLVVTAFAVALAMTIGNRLSNEALSVLAGAVCGVGAAIPTSLLILAASRRREEPRRYAAPEANDEPRTYPPVVVVAPPTMHQQSTGWNALPSSLSTPVQRRFTVVGGSPVEQEVVAYEGYSWPETQV